MYATPCPNLLCVGWLSSLRIDDEMPRLPSPVYPDASHTIAPGTELECGGTSTAAVRWSSLLWTRVAGGCLVGVIVIAWDTLWTGSLTGVFPCRCRRGIVTVVGTPGPGTYEIQSISALTKRAHRVGKSTRDSYLACYDGTGSSLRPSQNDAGFKYNVTSGDLVRE